MRSRSQKLLEISLYFVFIVLVYSASWENRKYTFIDSDPYYSCNQDDSDCFNYTDIPLPRQGHSAIVYTTYNTTDCYQYVENCNTKKNKLGVVNCPACNVSNWENLVGYARSMQQDGVWFTTANSDYCPGGCCPTGNTECKKRMDNTGYPIIPDDEIILIFGGMTARNKTFYSNDTNTNYSIFDECENYGKIIGNSSADKPDDLKSCGEELLNDLWRYSMVMKIWTPIKLDYNKESQTSVLVPSARYGHAGVYVEMDDDYAYLDVQKGVKLRRKYLYIYGGFSFDCTTACYDTWRYEIPFAPYAYYPISKSTWINSGNFWSPQHQDLTTSPGPRWRHAMIAFQRWKDDYTSYEEHYIYLFGGIYTITSETSQSYSGFQYKNDMWRFNLVSNLWTEVESYGISKIVRHIYLWNNTYINQNIETKDKLKEDMEYAQFDIYDEDDPNFSTTIQMPTPRGGHSMTLVGNPLEYIMVFGGSAQEVIDSDGSTSVIKKHLDDLWVFYIRSSQWSQVFVNSADNPPAREFGQLVTVKPDRLVILFGGQYGETLYSDSWQYNLNTNMWARLTVQNEGLDTSKNCSFCEYCTYCGNKIYFQRINCTSCFNCSSSDGDIYKYSDLNCTNCDQCVNQVYDDCVKCYNCDKCYNGTDYPDPIGLKGHSMTATSGGIVVYGGASWSNTNLTTSDEITTAQEKYLDVCRDILEYRTAIEQKHAIFMGTTYDDLSVDDMGTARWATQWRKTHHDCFNLKIYPAFPTSKRTQIYSSSVYYLSTSTCYEDCNDNGQCSLGRCTCKNGFHGSSCKLDNCYNSLCFVDIDTIEPQQCYHCSQNGKCVDGKCICNSPYFGPDCSQRGCPNNCSNTPKQQYGECIQDFPMGYCRCYEWLKRGGDDCSYTFCLNDCSGRGECVDGQCQCYTNYYGEDCSVYVIGVIGQSINTYVKYAVVIIAFAIYIFL